MRRVSPFSVQLITRPSIRAEFGTMMFTLSLVRMRVARGPISVTAPRTSSSSST